MHKPRKYSLSKEYYWRDWRAIPKLTLCFYLFATCNQGSYHPATYIWLCCIIAWTEQAGKSCCNFFLTHFFFFFLFFREQGAHKVTANKRIVNNTVSLCEHQLHDVCVSILHFATKSFWHREITDEETKEYSTELAKGLSNKILHFWCADYWPLVIYHIYWSQLINNQRQYQKEFLFSR